jgi:chromosomal replication initiator protein
MDSKELWENVLACLEVETSKANFAAFLSGTSLQQVQDGVAVVACPSSLVVNRIKRDYIDKMRDSLKNLTSQDWELRFEISAKEAPAKEGTAAERVSQLGPLFEQSRGRGGLFPAYTFENFVVGLSNQLAHAAALAVTREPGKTHNPLLIHSGVGLGKTHLMHAIGNSIKKNDPDANVLYCPAESFTNEMVVAIQNRTQAAAFRRKYRSADVLLVDDIQFLAGREATQEEFFNTFNQLFLSEKQVIMASDRHPQEIQRLEARLVSRFSGGMIVDIQPPDTDLRTAILKRKALERGETIEEEVLAELASQLAGSIRQLEGALKQLTFLLHTYQNAKARDFLPLLIEKNNVPTKSCISPESIMDKTSAYFGVSKKDIVGPCRRRELTEPRKLAMYLIRENTDLPLQRIGELFGGRDHTTALHAIKDVEENIKKDPRTNTAVKRILSSR